MKPVTIKELYEECKNQIKNGNGNKVIMISNDDEGNGYHYLWYLFSTAEESLIEDYMMDNSIANKEETIILG